MTNIISFVHHKGGTGKTTACLSIAGWLAKLGKMVLVIDLDPQGNATSGLGIDRTALESSVSEVFFQGKKIEAVTVETETCLYLAPSSIDLLAAETHLAGKIGNALILKEKLKSAEKYFDYILIDVPPASNLLMINGIVAAGNIIIPLDSGIFAFETMETLRTLLEDIALEIGVETNIMFVLLREYTAIRSLGEGWGVFANPTSDIQTMLKDFFGAFCSEVPKIFNIPNSIKIYEAQKVGRPISHFAPWSNVGRAYKKVADEIQKYTITQKYTK